LTFIPDKNNIEAAAKRTAFLKASRLSLANMYTRGEKSAIRKMEKPKASHSARDLRK
jgi:hypothetical protein